MSFSHGHQGPRASGTSSRTNSRPDNERASSYDELDDDRILFRNNIEDGGLRRQNELEEALLEKDMTELPVPEPPSQTGIVQVSFWIVVNTLATIGIVGSILLHH